MLEKHNDTAEKDAAGDAGVLDDIVDMAAGKMAGGDLKKRARTISREVRAGVNHIDMPGTAVC